MSSWVTTFWLVLCLDPVVWRAPPPLPSGLWPYPLSLLSLFLRISHI